MRLENQHKIVPVRISTGVNVNIDGACSVAKLEVIDIVYVSTSYLELLGMDWEFDNQMII
jgi:hypothetical protein